MAKALIHALTCATFICIGLGHAQISVAQGERSQAGFIRLAAKGSTPPKSKVCCGYPLVAEGQWSLRFYWMAMQDTYQDSVFRKDYAEEVVYSRRGFYLGTYPARFARALLMEGTGRLSDGRIINYAGRCEYGYGYCFRELDPTRYPYGLGAGRRSLVAFRSVAVDPELVPIGDTLYIPEFDGLKLPTGAVHDGCVRADDTGGNIKKRKMDFFVVTQDNFLFLRNALWGAREITPQIEHPRCEYLRRRGKPMDYLNSL